MTKNMTTGIRKDRWMVIALSLFLYHLSLGSAVAQMTPDKRYAPAYEYETYQDMPMVKAAKGWAARPIKVKGGGKTPDIVTLTKAFNQVWNVGVVSGVLKQAADPKFTHASDPEYDSETIVDRKNGYLCEDSGGTDSDYMEACVWRRDNGHRLFAICMGGPTDPEIEVVCFYDYDPATETMTPEASPADTFKPTEEYYNYNLPHKGKDFIISEYLLNEDGITLEHVYTWDGQKLVYSHDRRVKH